MGEVSQMILEGILCKICGGYIMTPTSGVPRECNYCEAKNEQGLGECGAETANNKLRRTPTTNVGPRTANDQNENGIHDKSDGIRLGNLSGVTDKE